MYMTLILFCLAYAVGSIPSGYLLVRKYRTVDVREYGSHNVGAINVCRVGGVGLGFLTLLADFGKAFAFLLVASALKQPQWSIAGVALLVMIGHAYSGWFYLREGRFSEGKSVASGLGVLVGLAAVGALPYSCAVFPPVVWLSVLFGPKAINGRWPCISVATMAATVSVPMAVWLSHPGPVYEFLAAVMAALILFRHKGNIRRLRAGTEPGAGDLLHGVRKSKATSRSSPHLASGA